MYSKAFAPESVLCVSDNTKLVRETFSACVCFFLNPSKKIGAMETGTVIVDTNYRIFLVYCAYFFYLHNF